MACVSNKSEMRRKTPRQIQELESMFKVWPHPDEKQRMQLSRDLGLEPEQIKFWFQNRRTQIKAEHERADNCALRAENDKIRCENVAIREALKNVICPSCGGSPLTDEQKLRMENARLKEELDRVSNITSNYLGRPTTQLPPCLHPLSPSSLDLSVRGFSPSLDLHLLPGSSSSAMPFPFDPTGVSETAELATNALMEELIRLVHLETYDRIFPRPAGQLQFRSSEMTILDLPELALECILGKLPPADLCSMASVCTSFKDRCRSDHLWERHMREKWGRVMGRAAKRAWELYVESRNNCLVEGGGGSKKAKGRRNNCSRVKAMPVNASEARHSLPVDSVMYWYLTLESGRFWFPAQVYNREINGHLGYTLSCYDAELSYDSRTDTFHARYPPHGQKGACLEEEVQWDRLRVAPVDTPAHELHISDCLNDLHPGDHVEVQWRISKEFLYGWWYGVVGHLESCDGNEHYCHCRDSNTIILEFNQFAPGSNWRQTVVDRKEHREEGNEIDGFYGGIRKLRTKDDISTWRRLWPAEVLE